MTTYNRKIPAGLSHSTIIADFDFETYSPAGFIWSEELCKWIAPAGAREKGLSTVSTVVYTEHPDAEVLCLAYDLKDGLCIRQWVPNINPLPQDLFTHLADGKLLEAWNVTFEYWVWANICVPKYGFPELPIAQLRCAAAKSRAFSLPGSLDAAGKVLDITHKKDSQGTRLLNKFSVPRNPTKNNSSLRNLLNADDPDAQLLLNYNKRDIEAEAEISARIPDLSDAELEFWQCDQAINRRGVAVDVQAIDAAIKIIEATYEKYNAQLYRITEGAVTAATQLPKMLKWVNAELNLREILEKIRDKEFIEKTLTGALLDRYNEFLKSRLSFEEISKVLSEALQSNSREITNVIKIKSLDEDAVVALLELPNLPLDVRHVLIIRQLIGSAAVKKLYALKNQTSKKGRVHNLFAYHKAHTGRATGVGPQPQNLPSSGPCVWRCECERHYALKHSYCPWCGAENAFASKKKWNAQAAQDAIEILRSGCAGLLEYYFGDVVATVSGCLRGMFIAAPGHKLVCSDYSAIEAVVLAELAGETWRQEVFRTHGKIYEMSASKITGVPFEEFLEYKKMHGEDHPLRKTVGKVAELASGYGGWISAWKRFGADEFFKGDEEIKNAVMVWRKASPMIVKFWHKIEEAAVQSVLNPGVKFKHRDITYITHNNILYCILPSGRTLTYHRPELRETERYGRPHLELSYEGWNSDASKGPIGWIRMTSYGGKLVENIVQAVARDILAHAIVELEREGCSVVLHIHDEIVIEIEHHPIMWPIFQIEKLERIMSTMPSWCANWPVKASGGWLSDRYSK